jgi:two-component system nitrogen regulation sensor histidine kinase GlnL
MPKINKVTKSEDLSLKEVFDAIADGIIILDKSFSILNMNDAAENIFNISRRKAYQKSIFTYLPEEIEETAKKALAEERTIMVEEINPVLRGGERIAIQASASPIFSGKGEIKCLIIQIRDLSGSNFLSKRSLQQISSSNFEVFITGLAHELKNPLSGIRGAAQILASETKNEETIKCADIIMKEADRLRDLIEKFKRLEPFAKDAFELVDIHEVLSDITFLESKSSSKGEINIIQKFDVAIPPILGNENSLKQAFLNIIKNAKEANPDNAIIEISTRWITDYKLRNENVISVEIRDNGEGIPKENLEKIFSPFYTTKKKGSGLGLFIAYQIIAKHGGAIFVESELSKGTKFQVHLPFAK